MKTVTIVDGVEMTRELWAKRITESWQKSIESILETGRNLIAAKEDLKHGDWMKMTKDELPFAHSTATRLMSISSNPVISNCAHGHNLPASWRTLAELTKLDDKTLEAKIEAGEVNPATQRKDVTAMLGKIKPESVATRQRRMERIEKERPDLAAKVKAGALTVSGADSIIAADKLQKKRTEFQGKASENAENAANELAEILREYCSQNDMPVESIISYLEECNAEQIIAVLRHGDASLAIKRPLINVLRLLQKEYGIPQFQLTAIKAIKEHTSPSLEALGEKIRREKEAAAKKEPKPKAPKAPKVKPAAKADNANKETNA